MMYWIVKPTSFIAATFGRTCYSLLFVSLLLIPLADRQRMLAMFRWRPLRESGTICYSVYIIRTAVLWTTFKFLRHSEPHFDSLTTVGVSAVAFIVMLGFAEFSWRFLKCPLIRRGQR